jgi:hypothetical protein
MMPTDQKRETSHEYAKISVYWSGRGGYGVACVCEPRQVLTTDSYGKKHCGLTARGYGMGQTLFGQKALEARMGDGACRVAATGVNSSGGIISTCQPVDVTNDQTSTLVIGGGCASAVKFYVSVYYY